MSANQVQCRGTGRTTTQLKALKDRSCFIWCTNDLHYIKQLCRQIGGTYNPARNVWHPVEGSTVYLYPRSILHPMQAYRTYGYIFREVVVDHTLLWELTKVEYKGYRMIAERVRSEAYFPERQT